MYEVIVESGVPAPMRDGTTLRADVYRPAAPGRYPVLLERVAYELHGRCRGNGVFYAQRGYVFVGQSVRGRFGSGGHFLPFHDDGWGAKRDGYDSVAWAVRQPWSNGRVGMFGDSYAGYTQLLAAATRPPHLQTCWIWEGCADAYADLTYRQGAYRLAGRTNWALTQTLAAAQHETAPPWLAATRERLERAVAERERWYRRLPLRAVPPLDGVADWALDELDHPADGPYWWDINVGRQVPEIDVPILHMGGWFDVFQQSAIRTFQQLRNHGRTARCREGQRLVVGPWIHGSGTAGTLEEGFPGFGPEATVDLINERLRWYDYWLKDEANGVMDGARVRAFLMGENRWLELDAWPPPGVHYQPYFLREGRGQDASSLNNGGLSAARPGADEPPDHFTYDPADPVPSLLLNPELGPRDHRRVEGRQLTYTSPPLARPLRVAGPVRAILYGQSTVRDTDWVARLCDVWPDGRSMSVCDGILRARYRYSLEQPRLLAPGEIARVDIDLWSTAQTFLPGHRVRLDVTSSDFPRYDRNLNTGGPFGRETHGVVATNSVYHDQTRASHLLLPVLG